MKFDNYPDKPLRKQELTSETIQQQIAEFEARGVKINKIDSSWNRGDVNHRDYVNARVRAGS